eukprot:superscaffoldBa00004411_g18837
MAVSSDGKWHGVMRRAEDGLATLLAYVLSRRGNGDITVGTGWGGSHTSDADTGGDNCLGNRRHRTAHCVIISISSTSLSSQETDDLTLLYIRQSSSSSVETTQ